MITGVMGPSGSGKTHLVKKMQGDKIHLDEMVRDFYMTEEGFN
jgi:ABC-type transporter Mla maintaining outer membrane lipid asymmetry ATPase subunit MlaF